MPASVSESNRLAGGRYVVEAGGLVAKNHCVVALPRHRCPARCDLRCAEPGLLAAGPQPQADHPGDIHRVVRRLKDEKEQWRALASDDVRPLKRRCDGFLTKHALERRVAGAGRLEQHAAGEASHVLRPFNAYVAQHSVHGCERQHAHSHTDQRQRRAHLAFPQPFPSVADHGPFTSLTSTTPCRMAYSTASARESSPSLP